MTRSLDSRSRDADVGSLEPSGLFNLPIARAALSLQPLQPNVVESRVKQNICAHKTLMSTKNTCWR